MPELERCPFCGGEAEYGLTMAGEEVYCTECKAAMPRITTEDATIEAWNKRAEFLQRKTMEVNCGDCTLRYVYGEPPRTCQHQGNMAFYCPITGKQLGRSKEYRQLGMPEEALMDNPVKASLEALDVLRVRVVELEKLCRDMYNVVDECAEEDGDKWDWNGVYEGSVVDRMDALGLLEGGDK